MAQGQTSRALPLGLDVAAVLGSDIAYVLADQAGATAFANYTEHVAALRGEVNGMNGDAWLENLYGALAVDAAAAGSAAIRPWSRR